MKRKNIWKNGIAAAILLMFFAAGAYAMDFYRADATAMEALHDGAAVTVRTEDRLLAFCPEKAELGLIFYPGGKVQPEAYAPLMRGLAEKDILCVLVEMPLNLAVLDSNAALQVPEQFPQITDWYIGGHSLGGSMAAACASENPEIFSGLILLAAYSTADLGESDMHVLSVYGTEDGVLNRENYAQYYGNLPGSTRELVIAGGNHAQFGNYGPQRGDGTGAITAQEQQRLTMEAMQSFLYEK